MRQHCKFTGIKGFLTLYNDGLRYRYMITPKALRKQKILIFWEKHGLEATMDAFSVKRSTLFSWKKRFMEGGSRPESLNEKKRIPKTRRKREWPFEIRQKIKEIRRDLIHPNLGPEKIHPLLKKFCDKQNLKCPESRTIARIISDDPRKMRVFPEKISHFGRIKKAARQKVLRKPKALQPAYPGNLVALDTIEKFINGVRSYVITFEDIYTRFAFAWATRSHASKAAEEFFNLCQRAFPYSFNFLWVLTDNGSEFKKHFSERLRELHLTHYHTYPKTPKMNAHVERFNKTIQDDFVDWHLRELKEPDDFNNPLMDYLIFYNTERVHYAFQNKLSPMQFMLQWQKKQLAIQTNFSQESRIGWHHTTACKTPNKLYNTRTYE